MNLHSIVFPVISIVNPMQPATLTVSTGYGTNPDGSRVPSYAPPVTVQVQRQELTERDLQQLEALNVQRSMQIMYLNGVVNGVVRMSLKGGDLITTQDGTVWLTTQVLEQWPDWVKVSVTRQDGS